MEEESAGAQVSTDTQKKLHMMDEVSVSDAQPTGSPDLLLSSLGASWLQAARSCGAPDADRRCVPAGLALLSAALLLLSTLLSLCRSGGEAWLLVYSFVGNLCSSVGAALARQLHMLVFLAAFLAFMDALRCILCCLQGFLCWDSKTDRRMRTVKRRRRQPLLAVGVLMVVAGGLLRSRADDPPALRPVRGRKLQVSGWSAVMDNTQLLGYILGLLGVFIAWTSRFPSLCRARRGQSRRTQTDVFSGLLCSLSGAFYAAALLLYDVRLRFLIRVSPWLLSSIGCFTLDLLIVVVHWCKAATRQKTIDASPETESLLGLYAGRPAAMRQQRKPSSAQTKKLTEMGQYMDVNQQTKKLLSLKDVTLSKNGPPSRVASVRGEELCSSDTSCSSASDSTDLEWDFEAAIAQWSKPAAEPQERNSFPLQDWRANPKPFSVCVCSMAAVPQKSECSAKESGSAVS